MGVFSLLKKKEKKRGREGGKKGRKERMKIGRKEGKRKTYIGHLLKLRKITKIWSNMLMTLGLKKSKRWAK